MKVPAFLMILTAVGGYTKYKLAKKAGIPHATWSDICSGKTKIDDLENGGFPNLCALAGLKVKMD